jgi:hypothetical protein
MSSDMVNLQKKSRQERLSAYLLLAFFPGMLLRARQSALVKPSCSRNKT